MSPAPDERDRILASTPQNSDGALTIVAVAHEAGVPKNALTQRHPNLRNEFYEQGRQLGATPDVEIRLRKTIVNLKKTIADKNKELDQLRGDVPNLIRVINQLTLLCERWGIRRTLSGKTIWAEQPLPLRHQGRSRTDGLPRAGAQSVRLGTEVNAATGPAAATAGPG
jgi:hypothetical protein